MCVVGIGVIEIGFIFLIVVCFNFKKFCYQECLIFILGCLLLVNGILLMMILRNMLLFFFVLFYMVFDLFFVFIILVIWCLDIEGVFVVIFCSEIFIFIFCCYGFKIGGFMVVIFFFGIFQLFFWFVLVIRFDLV